MTRPTFACITEVGADYLVAEDAAGSDESEFRITSRSRNSTTIFTSRRALR